MKRYYERKLEKILLHLNKQDHKTFAEQYEKHMLTMFWIELAICSGMFFVIIGLIWLAHFAL